MDENEVPTPIKTALEHTERGFECVELLGRGSFGMVVKAKCRNESKTYAIKILKINVESERLKYPKRELNALLRMTVDLPKEAKRNIIKYYECWIEKIEGVDQLFIQMELCSTNLWDFIYNNEIHGGPKIIQDDGPPRFYHQVFRQVLNGLRFIHAKRWIHRDIHPRNILVVNPNPKRMSDIHIKIADFGLARQIETELDITVELTILHKREKVSLLSKHGCFGAPELSTDKYDFKVDVYSAGLVLYFISCYIENEHYWYTELKNLKEGNVNVDESLFHKDDKKLSKLIKNLIQSEPHTRFSACDAMEYMFPEAKDATDFSMPKNIPFLARKESENDLSQCILKTLTLPGMKEEISRHTSVPKQRQILRQERMVNGELRRIKIENDVDVKNIIDVASKKGQEIVVVVSEKEDVEMTEMSAEPVSSEGNDMAEAMMTLSTSID